MRALVALTFLVACHKSGSDASEVIKAAGGADQSSNDRGRLGADARRARAHRTVAADQRSDVTADTQGKVINVMIERGQHVKLGQPVVQLDTRSAALSAREASAALASARVQKQLADDECVRAPSRCSTRR